jgi:hypothetical protein
VNQSCVGMLRVANNFFVMKRTAFAEPEQRFLFALELTLTSSSAVVQKMRFCLIRLIVILLMKVKLTWFEKVRSVILLLTTD